MRHRKRMLSLVLAILMVMTAGIATVLPVAAEGNEAKIGSTEYATLAAAIDAAKDGETITLLRDLTWTNYEKKIEKDITIDGGEQKYKILAPTTKYLFFFYQSFTLKNLKLETSNGVRFYNTAGKEAVGTLENVEWTLSAGLLVNIQGTVAGVPQILNVVNSTITKPAVTCDPIIATFSHDNWARPGICDVTINIENSTLNQNGGATDGNVGNASILTFCRAKSVTLNLKNNAILNYNPLGKADTPQSAIVFEVPTTVNADAGAAVHLIGSGAATAQNYFIYRNNNGSLTVNDSGATWSATKTVAARGVYRLPVNVYNGVSYYLDAEPFEWQVVDGEKETNITGASFRYTATSDTVSYTFIQKSAPFCKVGDVEYKSWADALNADGNILLIANAPKITAKIELTKDVVIDGQGKYAMSASDYFFVLAGHRATFRNLTVNSTHGVRAEGTTGAEVLFDGCTVNVTGGVLALLDKSANVTFQNTTVTATSGDAVILVRSSAVANIKLIHSTIDYRKGGNMDTASIFNIANQANATVVIDGTSKLIYSPNSTGTNNQMISVHDAGAVANITLKSGSTLEYNTVPASVTSLAFLRNASTSTLNLVDEGAIWTVSEAVAVAKNGYQFVSNAGTFNCKTVAMKAADGKLYSPTAAITTLTAKTSFTPIVMGVSNEAGASIRLSEPTGIRFGTKIDKDFFDALGSSAVYGVKVARKDALQNGNFAALTDANSVSYNSASADFRWVTEGEFFRTVLMNIGKDNYETALCWNAYVTITYADGTTATFWADWTEADNCRSLAEVAKSALADTTVTWTEAEAALLNTIAGN